MKLIQSRKNIITAISLISFLSCESIVDVDLPKTKSKIVVNSFFTPDSFWKVNISKSIGILEQFPTKNSESGYREKVIPEIKNANVEIWEENNLITKLEYDKNGYYKSNSIYPELNKNYTIKINAPNYEPVFASNIISRPVAVQNVIRNKISTDDYGYSELKISIKDINDVENFYELAILKGFKNGGGYFEWFESDDILLSEGVPIFDDESSFYGLSALFDDVIFQGEEYTLKIKWYESFNSHQNDLDVYVVLFSLNKELYTYLKSIKAQSDADDNPFSEPAFIHGNIEGGLGIFGGYSSYYYKVQ